MGTYYGWRTQILNHFKRRCGCVIIVATVIYVYFMYIYLCYQAQAPIKKQTYPPFPFSDDELTQFVNFMKSWCVQSNAKLDWVKVQEPCMENMEWGMEKKYWTFRNKTDTKLTYLTLWDLRPAGEFSRISVQSVSIDGTTKAFGGDSWRVNIRGPSSVSPTVIDHTNGTYEILFLVKLPGHYTIQMVLEYSLCDGYKNPPKKWFINGNAQGKYQPLDVLPGFEKPFLLAPLWGASRPFKITIPPSRKPLVTRLAPHFRFFYPICGIHCRYIWEGEGAWINKKWIPYSTGELKPQRKEFEAKNGTLWIYGDSNGDFFYKSIIHRPLCKKIFKQCNMTYNWVYNLPGANQTIGKLENDDLDFSIDRILYEISKVLNRTEMANNNNSVIILNLGLHYVQNINFTKYQELINRTIKLFKGQEGGVPGEIGRTFQGQMIWKTTTAMNREKYGDPRTGARHAKVIRFLTYQRVLLYNAYASKAMCDAGFDVLDIFPISNSYPNGTGLPHKPFDAVHYPMSTFVAAVELLERYFGNHH